MNGLSYRLHYIFRIACAMCFIGHGAFGIITKPIWCNYFGVFGIGKDLAYQIMPFVGIFDIVLGIILIVYPMRIIALWLIFWGLFTALLRPLSGEPFAEFLERAGNYGAPLFLIMLSNDTSIKNLFGRITPVVMLDEVRLRSFFKWLQVIGFALLFGHGWLNLIGKTGLLKQYAALGFHHPENVATIIGLLEIAGGLIILLKPFRQVIFFLLVWKIISELFYPAYGIFEWVERGGSYGVLVALYLVMKGNYYLSKPRWFHSGKPSEDEFELDPLTKVS